MKKILNNKIIQIVLIFILSYISFFVYSNYKLITNSRDIGKHTIPLKLIKYDGFKYENDRLVSIKEKPSITIDVYNMYFDKLSFDYKTQTNFVWSMEYDETDYRDSYVRSSRNGASMASLSKYEERLNINSKYIKIVFDTDDIQISNFQIDNSFDYFSIKILFFIFLFFIPYIYILNKKFFHKKVECLFLMLALAAGFSIIFNTPVSLGQVWDDQIHYNNVYSLANSKYTKSSLDITNVPYNGFSEINTYRENNIYKKYLSSNDTYLKNKKTDYSYSYEKTAYLPMSVSFLLARLFGNHTILSYYFGKIINLLVFTFAVFFAIKLTPKFKSLFMVIALTPSCLILASNYTYDAFTTGFIFLGISTFMHEYFSTKKVDYRIIAISIISFVVGVSSKAVYIPLILLLLLLDKDKFASSKKHMIFKISIILICILVMVTFILPALSGTMNADIRGGNTDVGLQLKEILSHPISFFMMISSIVSQNFLVMFFGGGTLTSFSYLGGISSNIYLVVLITICLSIFADDSNIKSKSCKKDHIFIFLITLLTIYMIYGALYLTFTPVGSQTVNGIQGRYFIPLIIPLFLSFFIGSNFNVSKNNSRIKDILFICMMVITLLPIYETIFLHLS